MLLIREAFSLVGSAILELSGSLVGFAIDAVVFLSDFTDEIPL